MPLGQWTIFNFKRSNIVILLCKICKGCVINNCTIIAEVVDQDIEYSVKCLNFNPKLSALTDWSGCYPLF